MTTTRRPTLPWTAESALNEFWTAFDPKTNGDARRQIRDALQAAFDAGRAQEADLKEALETLHDFRAFWQDMVRQTHLGASHHNPMWQRVATVLDKHGMNSTPNAIDRYFRQEPAYLPAFHNWT